MKCAQLNLIPCLAADLSYSIDFSNSALVDCKSSKPKPSVKNSIKLL